MTNIDVAALDVSHRLDGEYRWLTLEIYSLEFSYA